MTKLFVLEGTFADNLAQLLLKCVQIQSHIRSHKALCSFVMNISKDGQSLTSLDSLFQCFIMFIMHIFLLIFHQNSFSCSMCLLSLTLLLWTFQKSLALSSVQSPISVALESNQVPSELSPGWARRGQPLLIHQVLSCPWPHCWLFTGLPACLSYTLGSPN